MFSMQTPEYDSWTCFSSPLLSVPSKAIGISISTFFFFLFFRFFLRLNSHYRADWTRPPSNSSDSSRLILLSEQQQRAKRIGRRGEATLSSYSTPKHIRNIYIYPRDIIIRELRLVVRGVYVDRRHFVLDGVAHPLGRCRL